VLLPHLRPFLVHGLLDVPVDESTKTRSRLVGKAFGEQHDRAKCAGFGRDGELRPLEITPDLGCCHETNQETEKDAGSIPGESALKARALSPTASLVTIK
jgi:hypothetical protein